MQQAAATTKVDASQLGSRVPSPPAATTAKSAISSASASGSASASVLADAKKNIGYPYTHEEEMDMARYILDSGTEATKSTKYWTNFSSKVSLIKCHYHNTIAALWNGVDCTDSLIRNRTVGSWANHYRLLRGRIDDLVIELKQSSGSSSFKSNGNGNGDSEASSSKSASAASALIPETNTSSNKQSVTQQEYNQLAEFLVAHVAKGDLPTSADFGKFSEMVS
jgi:hypothetical protein